MKIAPEFKLKNMEDKPIKRVADDEEYDLTIRHVIRESLLIDLDPKEEGEKKADRFDIAMKFFGDSIDPIEVDRTQMKTIRDRIGEVQSTLIVGRSWAYLDSLSAKDKDTK